jgi:hypothetical protein
MKIAYMRHHIGHLAQARRVQLIGGWPSSSFTMVDERAGWAVRSVTCQITGLWVDHESWLVARPLSRPFAVWRTAVV